MNNSYNIDPLTPGHFAEKHVLKLVEWGFLFTVVLLRAKTYHKATQVVHFAAF